jgi:hypothetical protein
MTVWSVHQPLAKRAECEISMKNQVTAATAVVAVKPVVTAVLDRKYSITDKPVEAFKGAQRRITYSILAGSKSPMTVAEIAPLADAAGLKSKTPTTASVRYHLHHLVKDGFAKTV